MASHPTMTNQPVKKGCSAVIVFMIASFALVLGFAAGAGILYAYLTYGSNPYKTLGLESPAPAPAQQPQVNTPAATTEPSQPTVYALVYPIEETLRIDGAITPAVVRSRITSQRFKFQECYKQELDKDPNLKGEISLQFTVSNSSGTIIAAVSRQNTTGSEALTKCLVNDINKWKFAAIDGGKLSVVRFDTLFLPISSARPPE